MQFERIRKNQKRKIIIGGLILVCVISAITITTSRAKYKLTEDIPIVRGTINYRVPDLRLVALYTESDSGEYIESNDIPKSGYGLNREKSMCKVYDGSTSLENAPKDEKVSINYHGGVIGFDNVSKKNTRCYLYFDKINNITIDSIIASANPKDTTPDFSQIATTDEGVYKVSDPVYGGTSYYWRGATTNNYVKFGGFCWRIVRINGDKTMRLIYDGTTCHINGTRTVENLAVTEQEYNSTYIGPEHVGYTYTKGSQRTTSGSPSKLKIQNETWYNANIIGANASKVADGKFCNNRNMYPGTAWNTTGSTVYYEEYVIKENGIPSLSCNSGDIYTLKVGAITASEVIYAGGKWETANSSYYLYNGQKYWTMTPYYWTNPYAWVFYVNTSGYLTNTNVNNPYGLRPVINLRSDTLFQAGGDGTLNNPYVVI